MMTDLRCFPSHNFNSTATTDRTDEASFGLVIKLNQILGTGVAKVREKFSMVVPTSSTPEQVDQLASANTTTTNVVLSKPVVVRTLGGLVSRRVEMYEGPLAGARKGYSHRAQDSFQTYTTSLEPETSSVVTSTAPPAAFDAEESRDDDAGNNANAVHPEIVDCTKSTTERDTAAVPKVVPKIPKEYAGCALIESGVHCYNEGEFEKALKAFTAALKTQRVSVGDDDLCVALTLGNIGAVHLQQNNILEAERVLQASLDIKKRMAPDMIVADTLNNLGNCANIRGEYEASLIYYEEALDDIRAKKGVRPDEINALFNIGRLEIQRQHWTKAMIALNETCRMAREHYGTNHIFVAQTLDLMGFVQLSTSKMDASMVSFTGALAIYRRLYGPMHVEVANSLFNVGMVREANGDLADAWEAFTTARDLYSRLATPHDHPGYATVRKSIANVEKCIAKQNKNRLMPKRKPSGRTSSAKSDVL